MKPNLSTLTALTLATGVSSLLAQSADQVPIRYLRPMRNTFSVGARLTSGATVQFSNLGNIPVGFFLIDSTSEAFNKAASGRAYHNGTIVSDANADTKFVRDATKVDPLYQTGNITDITSRPIVVQNGRYNRIVVRNQYQRDANGYIVVTDPTGKVTERNKDGTLPALASGQVYTAQTLKDSAGNVLTEDVIIGDYVAYGADQTRSWSVASADQYVKDAQGRIIGVNMDNFGAVSNGGTKEASSGTGLGFELALDRTIRKESLRFEWGVKATLGLSTINAKETGAINATLRRIRDTYLSQGFIPANYTGAPTTAAQIYPDDPLGYKKVTENVIPLQTTPIKLADGSYHSIVDTANGATIDGEWQVKGAYYMVRIGPSARYYFSPRLSVSASAGVGVAYYTTRYNIRETLNTKGMALNTGTTIGLDTSSMVDPSNRTEPFDNRRNGVKIGPVGEVNLEWWLTPSTGFYGGVSYEKIGEYNHNVLDHTAKVKIGDGAAWRFGINTRF